MSSFCDRILKKSGERLSDEQVENLLTKMALNSAQSAFRSSKTGPKPIDFGEHEEILRHFPIDMYDSDLKMAS